MGAVYREELSANARKLIEQLLSLPQGWVTAAALAESIGVSRRTVLRELPAVEQWMQAAGAHFVRNPGKGLLLDEAPERRDALRTQLNSGDRKELSRAERRQQLLTRLLSEQEPCKTAVLARALGVSESTLSADLDELETKLHPYRVEMFRRPGVGVWLQGDASSYRRVVSALLRSSMPEKELAEVLCGRMPENEIFSTLLDTKTAEKVWAALQQFEQEEQLHLPDAGFLALAIHCTLTIQQLRQGGDKGSAPRGLRPAGRRCCPVCRRKRKRSIWNCISPPIWAQRTLGVAHRRWSCGIWKPPLSGKWKRRCTQTFPVTPPCGMTCTATCAPCCCGWSRTFVPKTPSWTPSAPPTPACGKPPAPPVMRCSSNSSCPPFQTMKRPTLPCTLAQCWNRMPCSGCGCGW